LHERGRFIVTRVLIAALPALLALGACSEAPEYAADSASEAAPSRSTSVDIEEEPQQAKADEAGVAPASIPVSLPKIAYVYEYGFRLPGDKISELQRRHADLCDKQGPQICRILDMRQSGSEGSYVAGSLSLAVAAPRARSFGDELARLAGEAGGNEVSSAISGEDLSKQIVDTEARLRARTVLRDRLMEVLETRKGTVAELVEAERAVAQVNEEIDQARSWLAEMQGRVDFSRVNVSYTSGRPSSGGFVAPIRAAVGSIGTILGTVLAAIIVLLTVLIPLGLLGWGLWWLIRLVRRQNRPQAAAAEHEPAD
jgi:hypothetical protein